MRTLILLASSASVTAFAPSAHTATRAHTVARANIVETAVGAGSFKTLVAAVTAAGLGPTLSGPGPFTVFAPTDEAFAKLPKGTVEALLKDIPKLTSILTYHVVPGSVLASTVVTLNGKKVKTVNGAEVAISIKGGNVLVDGATVVTTDIKCDNGVIHVIDSVILPGAASAPSPVAKINGWAPDAKKPLFGLPGAIAPFGFFDPLGFAKDASLNDAKRLREAEVMHGRVGMMAVVGYLVGESTPTPFGITGIANDQLQQTPLALFAALSFFIALSETFRATKGWVEPGPDSLFTLRPTYYPGDLGFDPLGLKPTDAAGFETRQAKELSNGRLAMLAAAGCIGQELVNGKGILENLGF